MGTPLVVMVGADKGGVGKTVTCRILADYLERCEIPFRPIDTEWPAGGLTRFLPRAEVLDIERIEGQMRAFDGLTGVTLIDVRAGLLSEILRILDQAQILANVRAGNTNLALLHVLGPSVQSLREVAEAASAIGGGTKHFLVKNQVSETATWTGAQGYASTLTKMSDVTIVLPHLIDHAAEAVDQQGISFLAFAQNGGGSQVLRGYTRTWIEIAWKEFERVGLGEMCRAAAS